MARRTRRHGLHVALAQDAVLSILDQQNHAPGRQELGPHSHVVSGEGRYVRRRRPLVRPLVKLGVQQPNLLVVRHRDDVPIG